MIAVKLHPMKIAEACQRAREGQDTPADRLLLLEAAEWAVPEIAEQRHNKKTGVPHSVTVTMAVANVFAGIPGPEDENILRQVANYAHARSARRLAAAAAAHQLEQDAHDFR